MLPPRRATARTTPCAIPHFAARHPVITVASVGHGRPLQPGAVLVQAGTPAGERGKAPMPREHSGEVYRGLRGTDATELAALVASGIISCASVFPEPQAREEVERLLLDLELGKALHAGSVAFAPRHPDEVDRGLRGVEAQG